MKAVAYQRACSIEEPNFLHDIELPDPILGDNDILVAVEAISVNPVDTKVRASTHAPLGQWKILGWDAAGRVVATGHHVNQFKIGDAVWYAGDLTRQGTNAQLHAVDARLVSMMPKSLTFAEAAALPLTSITAWEMLFDRLSVPTHLQAASSASSLLIIGGAGGVGSVCIQLAKALTPLTVIATASRPETQQWVTILGADACVNHHAPLPAQWAQQQLPAPQFVFSTNHSEDYIAAVAEIMQAQGRFGLIDDPEALNINPFKSKSISTHWEFMYTRSMFHTADMAKQGQLLQEVADLVDSGRIQTTLSNNLGAINAQNLMRAHTLIESGRTRGKIVLAGFD